MVTLRNVHPISLIFAQSPSSPSLTFLCHSILYHIWLPSKMSTLSHSYLPNLQNILLSPSFATLVSTMLGYPQKCPPYLTHIYPISTFTFSYLPLPTYYNIWLPSTKIPFTRSANVHRFCFLVELIQTLSLKQCCRWCFMTFIFWLRPMQEKWTFFNQQNRICSSQSHLLQPTKSALRDRNS